MSSKIKSVLTEVVLGLCYLKPNKILFAGDWWPEDTQFEDTCFLPYLEIFWLQVTSSPEVYSDIIIAL